jgi:zinc transport system substrate-binding protein
VLRLAATVALVALALTSCESDGPSEEALTVATTVYPVEFVAREVGGSAVEVVNVTPPGAEPHDVELSSDQVIEIAEADLVVYIGGDFQPAVEESLPEARGRTLDAFALLTAGSPSVTDVHFWLDPIKLARIARETAQRLAEIDPDNGESYIAAAEDLTGRLRELDHAFKEGLEDCASNDIVTGHEAFGQMAASYGLSQHGTSGLDPEAEPSPQRIADLAQFVRANDITTVFSETLLPADAAETIARETGAEVSVLDPLESAPEEGDYISAMKANLDALREGLRCR